jgi:hypothetical protein
MKRGGLSDALGRIVRALQPVDYFAHYECEVLEQNADQTLELKPALPKLGDGLQKVPIMVAGAQRGIKVQPGAKVLICFADGDPSKPRVTWWRPDDATFLEVEHQAQTVRIGPDASTISVELAGGTDAMILGSTYRSAEGALFASIAGTFAAVVTPLDAVAALKTVATALTNFEAQAAKYLSIKSKVG